VRREGLVAPRVSLGKSANEPQVQPSQTALLQIVGASACRVGVQRTVFLHVSRLRTLFSFGDFKFDIVAFQQALVSFASDGAEVNKNVRAIRPSDEAVSHHADLR